VQEGRLECTLADSNLVAFARLRFPEIETPLDLTGEQTLAWALPTHLWPALFGFKGRISSRYLKFATFWTWGFLTIYVMDLWIVDITVVPQTIPPAALPIAVLVAWRLARRAFPKKPVSELRMRYRVPSRPQKSVNQAVGLPGEVG